MSNLNPLLERNQAFAGTSAHAGLTPLPKHQLVIVTCMDGRVDPVDVVAQTNYRAFLDVGEGMMPLDDFVTNHLDFVGGEENVATFLTLLEAAMTSTI